MKKFKVFEAITNSYIGTITVSSDKAEEIKKSGFILVKV